MRAEWPGAARGAGQGRAPLARDAAVRAAGLALWADLCARAARARVGERLREATATLGAYLLFAAVALFYAIPEWRYGWIAFQDDTRLFYYPVMAAVGEALRQGSLGLWTPGMFGGYPLLADGGIGPLYPPHFLFLRGLPVDQAIPWLRVLHLFLAGVFVFHYLRVLRLGVLGGLVGGITFAYGGYFAAQTVHTNLAEASIWLPAALYCVERARRGALVRWAALGGVALGVQALAVHVNITLMSGLLVAVYTPLVFLAGPGDPRPASWRRWLATRVGRLVAGGVTVAIVGAVAVGLGAVQLLPLYELGTESFRGRGLSSGFAAVNSISPWSLMTLGLPRFFDDLTHRTIGWGLWIPWETEIYIGLLPLLLACVALLARPGFYVLLWTSVAVLALLVGFGNLGPWPLWDRLREVPFFNTLQSPGRFSLWSTLAIAVLAAHGAAWLVDRPARWRVWWTGFVLLLLGGVVAGLLAALHAARPWIETHRDQVAALLRAHLATPGAPMQPTGEPYPADWAFPRLLAALDPASPFVEHQARLLVAAFAVVVALWAAARLAPRSRRAAVARGALCAVGGTLVLGVVAVDLIGFGQDYHPRIALSALHPQVPPPLEKAPPLGEARLFTRPDPNRQFADTPNVLLPTGWEEATGFSSLESDRHARYVEQVDRTDNHLLDLLNARYFLDRGKLPDLPVFGGVPYHPGRPLANGVAANPGARAAFAVNKVESQEIGLVSWLRRGTDIPQGAEIGKVIVTDATGATYTLPLQAGVHTADAELDLTTPERPGAHQGATVAEALPAAADDDRRYEQRRYHGVVRLPKRVPVTRIEVQYTWPTGQFELFGIAPLRPDGEVEFIPPKEKYRWLYGDQRWVVAENTAALPRAFLVASAYQARHDQDVLAWMADGPFDPRKFAIVERARHARAPWPGWELEQDVPPGQARIERYRPEEVVIRTSSAHDNFLVLLDPYYPGWVATVDGQETEVYRANYLFRGVFVPAGERVVRFSYQPVPFRVGAALSLLTVAAVALLFYVLLVRWLIRGGVRLGRAAAARLGPLGWPPRAWPREAPGRRARVSGAGADGIAPGPAGSPGG